LSYPFDLPSIGVQANVAHADDGSQQLKIRSRADDLFRHHMREFRADVRLPADD
jgi:hypothetical protein